MSTKFMGQVSLAALYITISAPVAAIAQIVEDEIIVTGSPLVRSVDEAITGVSVLTGDELSDRLAATIGETLKTEPGVSSSFFGAGASRPIIRGQGGDRVRVLTNGIGSIDASSASPDHAVAAEPAQAERIEVLRGASLLRYGSSGSGGIVNVIDGRIPDQLPDGIEGAIRIGASSVDLGREVAGSLDKALGPKLVLHLDGTWRESDDYKIAGEAESEIFHQAEHESEEDHDEEDDDHGDEEEVPDTGQLANSFARSKSMTGGLSYVGDRGFLGFALHRFESDYGVPGGHAHGEEEHHDEDGDDDHEEEDHHDEDEHGAEEEGGVTIGLKQTRFDVNGALELDGFFDKLQVFGGYADYTHTEFEPSGEAGTVFANEGYEVRAEAIQAETNGWAAAYGVQLRDRDFSAIGEEAFVPPTNTRQIGVYTFHEKEIGEVHLEAAARYENTRQENALSGEDRKFDLISLSGGGDIHVSDSVRLGGTVFRTERAPTTEELFSNGPHLATEQFELGDPSLGKETATGIEAAFRHRHDHHWLTINGFYTDYNNFIFERETGVEEDGLPVFQFTGEDAKFSGFEVQGGTDLGTIGSFDLSADALVEYVRAKTDSDNLPRIPPLSALGGLELENEALKFRAEIDYADQQNKLAAIELPTEDYAQVNLFATWKAPMTDQKVRLNVAVLNLFDSEARQHTSFLKDIVPLPGRNVRFSMTAAF